MEFVIFALPKFTKKPPNLQILLPLKGRRSWAVELWLPPVLCVSRGWSRVAFPGTAPQGSGWPPALGAARAAPDSCPGSLWWGHFCANLLGFSLGTDPVPEGIQHPQGTAGSPQCWGVLGFSLDLSRFSQPRLEQSSCNGSSQSCLSPVLH